MSSGAMMRQKAVSVSVNRWQLDAGHTCAVNHWINTKGCCNWCNDWYYIMAIGFMNIIPIDITIIILKKINACGEKRTLVIAVPMISPPLKTSISFENATAKSQHHGNGCHVFDRTDNGQPQTFEISDL